MKKHKKRALFARFVMGETVEDLTTAVYDCGNSGRYDSYTDAVAYVEEVIRKGIRKGWVRSEQPAYDQFNAPAGHIARPRNTCDGCAFDTPAYAVCPEEDCLSDTRPDKTSVIFIERQTT